MSSRKRAPNFSKSEKDALVSIVAKYRDKIENKKTDAITSQEKSEAWFEIAKEFNARSPNMTFRAPEALRKYWANIKEDLRKRVGENRRSLYQTGGGPPPPDNTKPDDDLIMSIVNKKVITGLSNMFDNDALEHDENVNQANTAVQKETLYEAQSKTPDIELIYESEVSLPGGTSIHMETQSENLEHCGPKEPDIWSAQTKPNNLKQPLNKSLRKNIKRVRSTSAGASSSAGKPQATPIQRRPGTVRILSSSILGEKYGKLIDKKMELAECLKKEHSLRMQLLKYDLALKEKELIAAAIDKTDILLVESPDLLL